MKLTEKYTNLVENDNKKILLSNDAYAICEFLESLIKQLIRNNKNGRVRDFM